MGDPTKMSAADKAAVQNPVNYIKEDDGLYFKGRYEGRDYSNNPQPVREWTDNFYHNHVEKEGLPPEREYRYPDRTSGDVM